MAVAALHHRTVLLLLTQVSELHSSWALGVFHTKSYITMPVSVEGAVQIGVLVLIQYATEGTYVAQHTYIDYSIINY
jgi:hypothetical protein